MSERRTLKLTPLNRTMAHQGVDAAIAKSRTGRAWTLELREATRTDDQNDALHGLIDQIMKQRPVHRGVEMDKVRYKAVFMQALGQEMTMLPTLEGNGFFPLGLSTSRLTISEFSDLIEMILAWCAKEGIEVTHFDHHQDGEAPNKASPRVAA